MIYIYISESGLLNIFTCDEIVYKSMRASLRWFINVDKKIVKLTHYTVGHNVQFAILIIFLSPVHIFLSLFYINKSTLLLPLLLPLSLSLPECAKYYFLHKDKCEDDCPNGFFASEVSQECIRCHADCASCDGPDFDDCDVCINPKAVRHNGECRVNCPDNTYYDATTNECRGRDVGNVFNNAK